MGCRGRSNRLHYYAPTAAQAKAGMPLTLAMFRERTRDLPPETPIEFVEVDASRWPVEEQPLRYLDGRYDDGSHPELPVRVILHVSRVTHPLV